MARIENSVTRNNCSESLGNLVMPNRKLLPSWRTSQPLNILTIHRHRSLSTSAMKPTVPLLQQTIVVNSRSASTILLRLNAVEDVTHIPYDYVKRRYLAVLCTDAHLTERVTRFQNFRDLVFVYIVRPTDCVLLEFELAHEIMAFFRPP